MCWGKGLSKPLDNNAAERVLRGPLVRRKNFYGNRSKHGAQVAAILYSLIETAKLCGQDPVLEGIAPEGPEAGKGTRGEADGA